MFPCTQPGCTQQRRLSLVWRSREQSQAALTVPQMGPKRGSCRNCPQMLPAGLAAQPSPKTICSNFVQALSRSIYLIFPRSVDDTLISVFPAKSAVSAIGVSVEVPHNHPARQMLSSVLGDSQII